MSKISKNEDVEKEEKNPVPSDLSSNTKWPADDWSSFTPIHESKWPQRLS